MRSIVVAAATVLTFAAACGGAELFNGENLSGWSGDPRLWKVEDGVIVGETDDAGRKLEANSFLIWEGGQPGDFELSLKARVTGNNSGIQYRSRVTDPAAWVVGGYQMDLHPNPPFLGMLYEERGRGIACHRGQKVTLKAGSEPEVIGDLPLDDVKLDQWNDYRIVARGHRIQHFVNGKLAAQITDLDADKRADSGVIALQLHAGPSMRAEFKDLELRPISADDRPVATRKSESGIHWIWSSEDPDPRAYFRREFQLPPEVATAHLTLSCDNRFELWFNGRKIGGGDDWQSPQSFDVTEALEPGGRNVIAVEGINEGGAAALAVRMRAVLRDGRELFVMSDDKWRASAEAPSGWQEADFDAASWSAATLIGKMGDAPWGEVIRRDASGAAGAVDMTADFQVAPGFKLDRIYQVPTAQGSWVAMTVDDRGRLISSDQYGKLYRVTTGEPVEVEPLEIPIGGAHGLLWHRGVLYVSVNEQDGGPAGVYRVTDTDGDGTPDKPELIKAINGRGEHGTHSLVASPDGERIYFCAGNHTDMAEMDRSLPARAWDEDHLLSRRPDARGHARDRMAPGGWIASFKLDGSDWELVSIGYRNQFDMAFNDRGDLFTYDADMEWDFGMPWYRPTRICQVVAGSEFGWRNGTGKWPEYFEDSMPAVIDLGPGSPTGMVSGKGARFPAKYQQALYALDWTYATICAIHLIPDGAGYRAQREEFVAGEGLPLTDAAIGEDGAMYFLTGGRRTDSALWRVSYVGGKITAPVSYADKSPAEMTEAEAVLALGSPERVLRQEARLTLERATDPLAPETTDGPASSWRTIGKAVMQARLGGPEGAKKALPGLLALDWAALDKPQKLAWLRAAGLAFIRGGEPTPEERHQILAEIDASFPAADDVLNRELCRMLSYLQAPGVVGRTLALMDATGPEPAPDWLALAARNKRYGADVENMIANMAPAQVIHYVYCLRSVDGPWSEDERRRFFAWIDRLLTKSGGASYEGFLRDLRAETLSRATPEERAWLDLLAPVEEKDPFADLPPVKGPGRTWTIDEVVALADSGLEGRDTDHGKEMFKAALCAGCHRFGGEGGAAGPDLTALAGRFSPKDLAEAMIDPSKVVSDQYAFELITKEDGTQIIGRTVDEKDEKLIIATNPFDFSKTTEVSRSEIKDTRPSPVSPMPGGLINRLNEEELKDLLAYMLGK